MRLISFTHSYIENGAWKRGHGTRKHARCLLRKHAFFGGVRAARAGPAGLRCSGASRLACTIGIRGAIRGAGRSRRRDRAPPRPWRPTRPRTTARPLCRPLSRRPARPQTPRTTLAAGALQTPPRPATRETRRVATRGARGDTHLKNVTQNTRAPVSSSRQYNW